MVVMDVVVFMLEMVVMFRGVSCFVVFHVQKFDFERKDMLIEFRSQHTMLKELLAVVYPEEGCHRVEMLALRLHGVPGVGLEVEMNTGWQRRHLNLDVS